MDNVLIWYITLADSLIDGAHCHNLARGPLENQRYGLLGCCRMVWQCGDLNE